MVASNFKRMAEQNIFPGESGGDYNALFGYSNRDGGRYAATRLTDMTVNQALDFSKPSGDYGQWVKGQVGRVATPMGAYQVVGTTLRAAQKGLGLTGDERMTEGMQDRIGEWIYQNQGSGAWEGWRGGKSGGSQGIADGAMAAIGRQPLGSTQPTYSTRSAPTGGILSNEGEQMDQQQPQGLLSALGIQKRDPTAQGETSQPFYNRQSFGDTLARMAPALGRMGVMGLEGPAQAALDARNKRQGDDRALQKNADRANQTIAWMRTQPDGEQFAKMAVAVGIEPALKAMQTSANASQNPNVQSSSMLPDMSGTVVTMKDGSVSVITAGGGSLSGQDAMDFVTNSQQAYTAQQQDIYGARRTGTLEADVGLGGAAAGATKSGEMMVANAFAAFEQAGKATTAIGTMNDAIAAIDGGARSGLVENFLPNVTEASASLNNAMNRMGLDVISSVTFGALSEAEMKLAMETAAPRNLEPEALRAWLVSKRDAQEKARDALLNAARYFGKPGNTLDGWIESQQSKTPAPTAEPQGGTTGGNTLTFNPDTGGFD